VNQGGHRDRSEPMQIAIEEHEKHQQTRDHEHASHRHPEVGDEIALHATHQRERERECPDQ
jgi:hypothetical protein